MSLPALFAAAEAGNWMLQQWIAASTSGSDVSKWRVLIRWPFGEEGGVFRFNKAGDGLYAISSEGRYVGLAYYLFLLYLGLLLVLIFTNKMLYITQFFWGVDGQSTEQDSRARLS